VSDPAEPLTTPPAWVSLLRRQVSRERLTDVPTHSFGLRGVADGPPAPHRLVPLVRTLLLGSVAVVLVLLAALRPGPLVLVPLLVLAVALAAVASEGTVRHVLHRRRLRRALARHAPTTALAYAGRSGGPWQLRMWEPYLLRSGEPNVIINLHAKYVERILTEGDAPLRSPFVQLGSRGMKDLGDAVVPSLKAFFYVQNAQTNARFMALKGITHVWLNHGDSDKPANYNPRHADYDVLVVCGQAGVDRYANHGIHVEPVKFEILGRPQASDVRPARGPIASLEQPTVLYAPTWQGLDPSVNFSSLEQGPTIVRALLERGVRVVFRPHPLSYRWRIRRAVVHEIHALLKADRAAGGPAHVWGRRADVEWSVADCSNASDALISDVSSVVSDWLQSEKPYCMTAMRSGVEEFRAEYPIAQTAYVLRGDLENLDDVLDDLLERDPLARERSERKRYVLGDFEGEESADAFAAFVRRVVREGR
jgi:hypothetical protein